MTRYSALLFPGLLTLRQPSQQSAQPHQEEDPPAAAESNPAEAQAKANAEIERTRADSTDSKASSSTITNPGAAVAPVAPVAKPGVKVSYSPSHLAELYSFS